MAALHDWNRLAQMAECLMMALLHDPYGDAAVRRRHKTLVRAAVQRAFISAWLFSMAGGAALALLIVAMNAAYLGVVEAIGQYFAALLIVVVLSAIVATIAACAALLLAPGAIRASQQAWGPGFCVRCGYSLAGIQRAKCPECGEAIGG